MYNIIYYLTLVFLDSFLYGYCFEIKQKKLNVNSGIFKFKIFDWLSKLVPIQWLFPVTGNFTSIDETWKTYNETPYRVFQKLLEIGGAVLVCYLYDWSWIPMAGILLANYLLSFDLGYYVLMNQFSLLKDSNQHLRNWYTVGILFPKNFDIWSFVFLGSIGILFLIRTGR